MTTTRRPRILAAAGAIGLLSLLGGCAAGPGYQGPPPAGTASSARGPLPSAPAAGAQAVQIPAQWWTLLDDPHLSRLIERALKASPDVAIALARLDQAEAGAEQAGAVGVPRIAATAGGVGGASSEAPAPRLLPGRKSFATYDAGLRAGWEIDLYGRGKSQRLAALARRDAADAALADVQVMLSAAVAQAYLGWRAQQAAVAIETTRLDRHEQILRLDTARAGAGTASSDAVLAATAARDTATARLALARADLAIAENNLSALVGDEPGGLELAAGELPLPPADVAVPDAAAVLRNRPDIRIAERRLAAAAGDRDVALAERFPRISLLGVLGIGGSKVDGPLSAPSLLGLAMPRISLPIFDGGRTKADIRRARAAEAEAAAIYRQTVRAALRDSDNALAEFGARRIALAQAISAAQAAGEAARLAASRYAQGSGDRLASERSALAADAARLETVAARARLSAAFVAVMKALGLGWSQR